MSNKELTPHPKAEILRAIADGRIIEHRYKRVGWMSLSPSNAIRYVLAGGSELRINPETITINGIEVPAPEREPLEKGQEYWVVCIDRQEDALAVSYTWRDDEADAMWMKRGLIQLTEEGAIAQAKAMIAAVGCEV